MPLSSKKLASEENSELVWKFASLLVWEKALAVCLDVLTGAPHPVVTAQEGSHPGTHTTPSMPSNTCANPSRLLAGTLKATSASAEVWRRKHLSPGATLFLPRFLISLFLCFFSVSVFLCHTQSSPAASCPGRTRSQGSIMSPPELRPWALAQAGGSQKGPISQGIRG